MQNIQESDYQQITSKVQKYVPIVNSISQNVNKIIGLIGSTGSGKSTLTSYIQDAPLQYQKLKGAKYVIDHGDNSGKYPKIGHQMKSCTSVPAIFESNGESFVDLTGWFDTGSSNQQIINAFSNSSIFKKGKQVKIVIVAEISSIIALRGGILVDIVHRLSQFFEGDLTMMINSILLVLSKVNTDDWDVQTATQQIQKISQLNQNLNQSTKLLITTLIRNKRIVLFPTPDKITNHVATIKTQMTKLKPTVLTHNGKVTLSYRAHNVVSSYISKLNGQIAQSSKKVAFQIKSKFLNVNFTSGTEVNSELCKLRKAETILKAEFGKSAAVRDQIRALQELKSNLGISVACSEEITKNFTMVSFYRKLNGKINIQSSFIETVSLELSENIGKLEAIRANLTSEEERKQMEKNHQKQMKEREKQNQDLIKKSQEKLLAIAKQNNEKIQKQTEQFYKQMKESDAKYADNLAKMNQELIALANRPPQVVHVNDGGGGGCEIM